jgi:hypothetical protein
LLHGLSRKTGDLGRVSLHIGAVAAGDMFATDTRWLVVPELRAIATFAADINVRVAVHMSWARKG